MDRTDILNKLRALDWPKEDYWVVAGAAMVLHGLRAETRDLDLGCTTARADRPLAHPGRGGGGLRELAL